MTRIEHHGIKPAACVMDHLRIVKFQCCKVIKLIKDLTDLPTYKLFNYAIPSLIGLIILVFLPYTSSSAQSHFNVTYIKGKVELKSKKLWTDLKVTDKLTRDHEVRLDRNAILHLTDSAGVPILLTLPGIYKIGDFYNNSHSSSVMIRNGAIVMGRVARVQQNFFGSDAPIKVLLPRDSTFATVYAKQFVIRWIDPENKGPYVITVRNLFKETIATYNISTNEMTFDLDVNDVRFQKERVFYFTVASASNTKHKSHEHVVKRISIHERYRIDDILNKEIILDNSRALDQLVLAGFYEEHALFADAVNAYLESIRLGKDDPVYSEAFGIFLQRYGLE